MTPLFYTLLMGALLSGSAFADMKSGTATETPTQEQQADRARAAYNATQDRYKAAQEHEAQVAREALARRAAQEVASQKAAREVAEHAREVSGDVDLSHKMWKTNDVARPENFKGEGTEQPHKGREVIIFDVGGQPHRGGGFGGRELPPPPPPSDERRGIKSDPK